MFYIIESKAGSSESKTTRNYLMCNDSLVKERVNNLLRSNLINLELNCKRVDLIDKDEDFNSVISRIVPLYPKILVEDFTETLYYVKGERVTSDDFYL